VVSWLSAESRAGAEPDEAEIMGLGGEQEPAVGALKWQDHACNTGTTDP